MGRGFKVSPPSSIRLLAERVRSRSKHWFLKRITVKTRAGNTLVLSMKDPHSSEVATEEYVIDTTSLENAWWNDDTRTEIADDLIRKFLYPVRQVTVDNN